MKIAIPAGSSSRSDFNRRIEIEFEQIVQPGKTGTRDVDIDSRVVDVGALGDLGFHRSNRRSFPSDVVVVRPPGAESLATTAG